MVDYKLSNVRDRNFIFIVGNEKTRYEIYQIKLD
jgi:hypothetical protein